MPKHKRIGRRINERPAPPIPTRQHDTIIPKPIEPLKSTGESPITLSTSTAPGVAVPIDKPETTKEKEPVENIALRYYPRLEKFALDRMQDATVDKARRLAANTPELFGQAEGSAFDELPFDVGGLVKQVAALVFQLIGVALVKANRLHSKEEFDAFQPSDAKLARYGPVTEKIIEKRFGAKLRNLPPEGQLVALLAIDTVEGFGRAKGDARTIEHPPAGKAAEA